MHNVYREQIRDNADQMSVVLTQARKNAAIANEKKQFPTILFLTILGSFSSVISFALDVLVGFVLVGIFWFFLGDRYPIFLLFGILILALGLNLFRRVVRYSKQQNKIITDSGLTITRLEKGLNEISKVNFVTWCDLLEAKRIRKRMAAIEEAEKINEEQRKWTLDEEKEYFEIMSRQSLLSSILFGDKDDED